MKRPRLLGRRSRRTGCTLQAPAFPRTRSAPPPRPVEDLLDLQPRRPELLKKLLGKYAIPARAVLGHAPDGNGQNTTTFLGKILRIDVDNAGEGMAYGIPADNPFVGQEGILPEIYALGLRNPWRISFDTGGDFRLFVSDVGQNSWEEVDIVTSGGNYGWHVREGTHCFDVKNPNESPASCPDKSATGETLIDPIIEYGHDLGTAVVGGYVYHGQALPKMQGKYIFADWSNDFAKGNGTLLAATPSQEGLWSWEEIEIAGSPCGRVDRFIRSLGLDDEGEIYLLTSDELGPTGSTGKIFKMMAE